MLSFMLRTQNVAEGVNSRKLYNSVIESYNPLISLKVYQISKRWGLAIAIMDVLLQFKKYVEVSIYSSEQ